MMKLFLILLLLTLGNPLEAEESVGGQEVEEVKVEKRSPEQEEKAEKLFYFEDLEKETEFFRSAQASDVVGPRPDPEGVPTKVKIGLFVTDIALIDDAEQTFTANILLVARWIDPRLKSSEDEVRQFQINSVWNPLISIVNERNIKPKLEESVFVQPTGHVIYAQSFNGKFTVPLNLKDFPFDKHKLYIRIKSFYSPSELEFIIDESLTGWSDKLSIPDWIVSDGEAKITTTFSKVQDRDQSVFEFSFKIKRLLGFYLWKIILPLTLIVFISWGVLWIDPKRLEAQIGLSATTFLTLFAFQFAIAALLPRVSYLTRMDRYTMLCSLLVFLSILKAISTSYFIQKKENRKAQKVDYAARIFFPLAFFAIIFYSFYF